MTNLDPKPQKTEPDVRVLYRRRCYKVLEHLPGGELRLVSIDGHATIDVPAAAVIPAKVRGLRT